MSYHFGQEKPAEAGFIFYTISMSIYYIFHPLRVDPWAHGSWYYTRPKDTAL